jgi:hypothetical protein
VLLAPFFSKDAVTPCSATARWVLSFLAPGKFAAGVQISILSKRERESNVSAGGFVTGTIIPPLPHAASLNAVTSKDPITLRSSLCLHNHGAPGSVVVKALYLQLDGRGFEIR